MATRYRWIPDSGKYRDLRTGRFVSSQQVRRAIDQTLRADQNRARTLADDLRAGRISRERFGLEARAMVKEVHIYSAAAARGGFEQMDDAAYGQVGAALREQYGYLNKFLDEVESGAPLRGNLSSRLASYVSAGRNTHERARRNVDEEHGLTEEKNVTKDAQHCAECPALTDLGWVPLGTLPLPGARECKGGCVCEIIRR